MYVGWLVNDTGPHIIIMIIIIFIYACIWQNWIDAFARPVTKRKKKIQINKNYTKNQRTKKVNDIVKHILYNTAHGVDLQTERERCVHTALQTERFVSDFEMQIGNTIIVNRINGNTDCSRTKPGNKKKRDKENYNPVSFTGYHQIVV